jgi:ABC-type nitrate/sulfonate/bicarbonate transport system ATPase subunit
MSRLIAEHLWVQYKRKLHSTTTLALKDINLVVEDGEFVSIVGPSGCGKTTLLKCIAGLLKPTSGRVLLNDQPVTAPGPFLGFVFQSPLLFPWRSVQANIGYGMELAGVSRQKVAKKAEELADIVGLTNFLHSYPHELSGGMQQRVNLARALALEPQGILLDEPFSALDAQTREFMQEELQRIWRTTQTTAVFITHQISEAIYLADRVIVLSARPGQLLEQVHVPFPHPRPLDLKRTPEFRALEDHVWAICEDEFRRSWLRDAKASEGVTDAN